MIEDGVERINSRRFNTRGTDTGASFGAAGKMIEHVGCVSSTHDFSDIRLKISDGSSPAHPGIDRRRCDSRTEASIPEPRNGGQLAATAIRQTTRYLAPKHDHVEVGSPPGDVLFTPKFATEEAGVLSSRPDAPVTDISCAARPRAGAADSAADSKHRRRGATGCSSLANSAMNSRPGQ